jgi:geranylgeranyl reductase family protein
MTRKHDVIIVGGGAVGLYAASLLEKSLDVLVVERQKTIGHKVCSGLVSVNVDGFVDPGDSVEHKVSGALLHSPGGATVGLKKKSAAAYVIDRKRFDRLLAGRLSCHLKTGVPAREIRSGPEGITVKTGKGDFKSEIVIGCDGAGSVVRNHMSRKPSETLTGLIAITPEKNSSDHVDLFFDKNFVKDGFFWKIPRGRATEYGAMGSAISFQTIESFFKIKNYEKQAAPIPLGPPKTFADRALLIGDSAAQVKPWSGGGVVFGFTAAKIAAGVLKTCFQENDFTAEALSSYELEWRNKIGKEIGFGLMGREMLKDLTNRQLDGLFNKIQGHRLSHLDMDFPVFSSLG